MRSRCPIVRSGLPPHLVDFSTRRICKPALAFRCDSPKFSHLGTRNLANVCTSRVVRLATPGDSRPWPHSQLGSRPLTYC
jgi:hypothetical protein